MVCSGANVSHCQYCMVKHFLLQVQVVLHDVIVHLRVIGRLLAASRQADSGSAAKRIWDSWKQNFGDIVDRRVEQVGDDHLHLEGHSRKRPKAATKRRLAVAKDIPCKTNSR